MSLRVYNLFLFVLFGIFGCAKIQQRRSLRTFCNVFWSLFTACDFVECVFDDLCDFVDIADLRAIDDLCGSGEQHNVSAVSRTVDISARL